MTVVSITGVAPDRRESLTAAILSAGDQAPVGCEVWVLPGRRPPAYLIRMIGPDGFFREARFQGRETPEEIARQIRETVRGIQYLGSPVGTERALARTSQALA